MCCSTIGATNGQLRPGDNPNIATLAYFCLEEPKTNNSPHLVFDFSEKQSKFTNQT